MDETGIYSVICCHGIVQFLMDMVQSSELWVFWNQYCTTLLSCMCSAKYPIAAADKLIHTFGSNILFAYDIGCTFSVTLSKSSVGKLAKDFNFISCTGSFHGMAHNRLCQLCYHIGFKEGAGIEDGEGNEWVFSASNALATVTRHATAYYQQLQIHIHFEKWDLDKYECLGMIALACQGCILLLIWWFSPNLFLGDFLLRKHSTVMQLIKDSTDTL